MPLRPVMLIEFLVRSNGSSVSHGGQFCPSVVGTVSEIIISFLLHPRGPLVTVSSYGSLYQSGKFNSCSSTQIEDTSTISVK